MRELQGLLTDDMTLCLDMGSFHIWLARYLYSFRPRQVLVTNGQQTLGVALPWAIAACLVRPGEKVMSVSGDGGFCSRRASSRRRSASDATSSTSCGSVQFAEAFGARGLTIGRPDDIVPTLKRALDMPGPVVVGVPVDYRDNQLHEWGLGSNRFLGEV